MIGISFIERIESLHSKNLLHRDIKPENFVIGSGSQSNVVFMIDFGLARLYKNAEGRHISMKEGNGLIGTARYCSVNAHLGRELSRRDDLESIGYTLIYFLKSRLPWQNVKGKNRAEKYKKIKKIKMNIKTKELCSDIPECFKVYMDYVKNLNFAEAPSYSNLKKIFLGELANQAFELDYCFDWCLMKDEASDEKEEMDEKSPGLVKRGSRLGGRGGGGGKENVGFGAKKKVVTFSGIERPDAKMKRGVSSGNVLFSSNG